MSDSLAKNFPILFLKDKMTTKSWNYWPTIIIGLFVIIFLSLASTIYVAVTNPISIDPYFDSNYEYVKSNYKTIESMEEEFIKNFSLTPPTLLKIGHNQIQLKLNSKNKTPFQTKVKAQITRPASGKGTIHLENFSKKNIDGQAVLFVSPTFELDSIGRWQIHLYFEIKQQDQAIKVYRRFDYEL